jgi:hypothetical protein
MVEDLPPFGGGLVDVCGYTPGFALCSLSLNNRIRCPSLNYSDYDPLYCMAVQVNYQDYQ